MVVLLLKRTFTLGFQKIMTPFFWAWKEQSGACWPCYDITYRKLCLALTGLLNLVGHKYSLPGNMRSGYVGGLETTFRNYCTKIELQVLRASDGKMDFVSHCWSSLGADMLYIERGGGQLAVHVNWTSQENFFFKQNVGQYLLYN